MAYSPEPPCWKGAYWSFNFEGRWSVVVVWIVAWRRFPLLCPPQTAEGPFWRHTPSVTTSGGPRCCSRGGEMSDSLRVWLSITLRSWSCSCVVLSSFYCFTGREKFAHRWNKSATGRFFFLTAAYFSFASLHAKRGVHLIPCSSKVC